MAGVGEPALGEPTLVLVAAGMGREKRCCHGDPALSASLGRALGLDDCPGFLRQHSWVLLAVPSQPTAVPSLGLVSKP